MSRERRGFARLYIGVEAIYSQKDKENTENTVLVQDISVSGVRFIANEILPENTELTFTLNIPDIPIPLTATGKVIWQKQFSQSFYDTGIDFIAMENEPKACLANYIKKALGRVEESRGYVRSNLSTMVTYRLADSPDEQKRCITVDVSSTGIKVFVKEFIALNTIMQLSFNIPEEAEAIQAEGKIIWCNELEEKFYEAGIEFTLIDEKYIDSINNYVKRTLGIKW